MKTLQSPLSVVRQQSYTKRIVQLDGLRAFAFLAVFCNHAIPVPLMWVGVDIFFVMSGFLITGILLNSRTQGTPAFFGRFYARRARRILPPYCIALGLAVALRSDVDWRSVWPWLAALSANVPVAFMPNSMGPLGVLWSLAVEEHFYLAWPLLIHSFSRKTLRRILVLVILIVPVLRLVSTPFASQYLVIFTLTPFRVDALAAGSLIALTWDEDGAKVMSWRLRSKWIMMVAGGAFAGLAFLYPAFRAKANSLIFNTVGLSMSIVVSAALVIYVLTSCKGWAYSLLTNRIVVGLGTISYMAYLVHEMFLRAIGHARPIGIIAAFISTVAFSAVSWNFVEAPILGRRQTNLAPDKIQTSLNRIGMTLKRFLMLLPRWSD
jgi:peptidoglycan/LPS O-acetylase OafA/YrhL